MSPKSRTLLMAALLTGAALASSGGQAHDYPYCLQGNNNGIPGDCSYSTYQQCQATASGTTDYCGINPRVAFQTPAVAGPQHHHRRHGW